MRKVRPRSYYVSRVGPWRFDKKNVIPPRYIYIYIYIIRIVQLRVKAGKEGGVYRVLGSSEFVLNLITARR